MLVNLHAILIFILFTCNKLNRILSSLLNTNQFDLLIKLESKLHLNWMQSYAGPQMMAANLDESHQIPLHS